MVSDGPKAVEAADCGNNFIFFPNVTLSNFTGFVQNKKSPEFHLKYKVNTLMHPYKAESDNNQTK